MIRPRTIIHQDLWLGESVTREDNDYKKLGNVRKQQSDLKPSHKLRNGKKGNTCNMKTTPTKNITQ